PMGPPNDPVKVPVRGGTEKQEWLTDAAQQFETAESRVDGHPITVKLDFLGSRDIALRVARGDSQPAAVTPASSIEIELLRDEWQARYGKSPYFAGEDA